MIYDGFRSEGGGEKERNTSLQRTLAHASEPRVLFPPIPGERIPDYLELTTDQRKSQPNSRGERESIRTLGEKKKKEKNIVCIS